MKGVFSNADERKIHSFKNHKTSSMVGGVEYRFGSEIYICSPWHLKLKSFLLWISLFFNSHVKVYTKWNECLWLFLRLELPGIEFLPVTCQSLPHECSQHPVCWCEKLLHKNIFAALLCYFSSSCIQDRCTFYVGARAYKYHLWRTWRQVTGATTALTSHIGF